MSAAKQSRDMKVIEIPNISNNDMRCITHANYGVQAGLAKRRMVDLDYYAIPEAEGDVYRRRITVVKSPKSKTSLLNDMPDLEDCQLTNLPWAGYVTFKSASRQFRAKNQFAVSVEVVRQFGDYLYLIYESMTAGDDDGRLPRVYDVIQPTVRDAYYTVKPSRNYSTDEIQKMFRGVPQIPAELIAEMVAIGYTVVEDGFVNPNIPEGDVGHKLLCGLYGKLQNVRDTSLCLV